MWGGDRVEKERWQESVRTYYYYYFAVIDFLVNVIHIFNINNSHFSSKCRCSLLGSIIFSCIVVIIYKSLYSHILRITFVSLRKLCWPSWKRLKNFCFHSCVNWPGITLQDLSSHVSLVNTSSVIPALYSWWEWQACLTYIVLLLWSCPST